MHRTGTGDNPYRRKARAEVKRLAREIHRKFHPERILLFGSMARGDVHALSDIDLVIIAEFKGSKRDRVEQLLDLAQGLDLSFPVEPLPLCPEEFKRLGRRSFFKQIIREAVEL
jgi:uncharacterized protein